MAETFFGYIETTQDVLLIFEGCRRGLLPRVCRRLQEKERKMIRSGSVFVFDERESGIKRWTDGMVWSPSRILGNFLIYRELDKKAPGDKKRLSVSSTDSYRQRSFSVDDEIIPTHSISTDRNRERRLVGSLSDSYRFRRDGLIKKTMSIIVNGVAQHLISYYLPNDIIENKLRTPSSVPELASLEISPDLLIKQNFRVPPMVEPSFEPAYDTADFRVDDRRIHPFRSMSMSAIRSLNNSSSSSSNDNNSTNNHNNLMYTMDNQHNKLTSNFYTPNHNNLSLPSPASITSLPNTPMLSPVRHSTMNTTNMRYSANRNHSFDISMTQPNYPVDNQNIGQLLNPIHPLNSTNQPFYPPQLDNKNNTYNTQNYYFQQQKSQQESLSNLM